MPEKDTNLFNIDHQWNLYLERVGLKGQRIGIEQYRELKRAFFGATGQLLMLMKNELAELDESAAVKTLESMINEVGDYWLKQGGRAN